MGRQYTIEHYLERLDPDPRGGARDRDLDRRHRRLLRRDRGPVRGDARAARDRPLRPGLRGGLLAAARDARHAPRRRRAGGRQAPPAERAARRPGGDRARAQRGVARAARSRSSSTPSTPPREHDHDASAEARAASAAAASSGRTRGNKLVHLAGDAGARRARTVTVRIDHAGPYALRGALVGRVTAVTAPHRRSSSSRGPTATGKTGLAIRLGRGAHRDGRPGRGHLGRLAAGLPRPRHRHGQGDRRGPGARPAPRPRPRRPGPAVQRRRLRRPRPRRPAPTWRARGGVAILAGGTGLYLRAVARGLDTDALPSDPAVRARLEAELARDGLRPLVGAARGARARRSRPASTCATRAASSGRSRSPSSAATARRRRRAATRARSSGSGWPSSPRAHAARIAARARAQFDAGLVEEARALRERFDPAPAGLLGDRLPRGLGGPRRRADARRGDRARRPAQRRVRQAPADLVPLASPTSTWLDATDDAAATRRGALAGRDDAASVGLTGSGYPSPAMTRTRPDRPRAARREGLPRRRRHRRRRRLDRRGLAGRARQPRHDRRRRGRRRRVAEPPPRRPELVRRQGQGRGARRGQARDRASTCSSPTTSCRPAQQKALEEPAQRQGHRPQPADPRHLRAARPDPRGPPPGRARPARVPAAAPDPAVDPPVADPGRDRLARPRREPARDRPPDHPRPDQEDEGAGRAGPPAARDRGPRPRPPAVADRRHRRLHERRQVDAAQRARRLRGGARPRTSCSRRSTRPAARSSSATARPRS